MRYCGSVDTVPAYQRVKKQPHSPEQFKTRSTKGKNHMQDMGSMKTARIAYKMQINRDDEQAEESMEQIESLGKCLSYSPDAPKALGIASKRRVHSSISSSRKGFDNKEPSLYTSRELQSNASIASLLVRYQSIVELSSSSSSLSSSLASSSSASPSTSSPHNNFTLL